MNKLKLFGQSQKAVWLLIIITLVAGYYLRAYFYIHHQYDFSPYDILLEKNGDNIFNINLGYDVYTFKTFSYPLSHVLKNALGILNSLYLIYFAAAAVIFFFGKEFSRSVWGGALALLFFTVAPENLLQYTKDITPAGLNYVLSWLSLLFFFRYFRRKNDLDLLGFVVAALLGFLSYHTGAAALAVIIACLLVTLLLTDDRVDSKLVGAICGVLGFYIFWLLFFDFNQVGLIRGALFGVKNLVFIGSVVGAILLTFLVKRFLRPDKYRWLVNPWVIFGSVILATILVLSPVPIFNKFLGLGIANYYASAITLNNYLAQALIGHVYILVVIFSWSKFDQAQKILLAGWLAGLVIIFSGLVLEDYFARIFDYSFPLLFLLFGYYWTGQVHLRKLVVTATVIVLFASQLIIFNDPFSLRRYYRPEEVRAAQTIIDQGVKYRTFSDLRTMALFHYLGETEVELLDEYYHQLVFYYYDKIKPGISNREEKNIYLIAGESMKSIVYAENFQTTPLDKTFYDFFENNFELYFDAGQFKVYQLK